MEENLKRLAEALISRAFVSHREYEECRYCRDTQNGMQDIEHDSECPVLLAQEILRE